MNIWLHAFLNSPVKWRWMISFNPRPLYPWGDVWCPFDRRLGLLERRSGRSDDREMSLHFRKSSSIFSLVQPLISSLCWMNRTNSYGPSHLISVNTFMYRCKRRELSASCPGCLTPGERAAEIAKINITYEILRLVALLLLFSQSPSSTRLWFIIIHAFYHSMLYNLNDIDSVVK